MEDIPIGLARDEATELAPPRLHESRLQKDSAFQADTLAQADQLALSFVGPQRCAKHRRSRKRKGERHQYVPLPSQRNGNFRMPFRIGTEDDSGRNAADSSAGAWRRFFLMFMPYKRAHMAYLAYRRGLFFSTVVPKPPHTFREYVASVLHYLFVRALNLVLCVLVAPVWFVARFALILLYRQQRRAWLVHRGSWPHRSQPHVRPVRHAPDSSFPLDGWHLRCEDGRQRWYYGAPLQHAEEGNILGRAQACGYSDIRSYRAHLAQQRGQSQRPTPKPVFLERKIQQRCMLERYQLGLSGGPPECQPRETSEDAMQSGLEFLMKLQDPFSGHWPNGYGGCQFLTPGVIFVRFIVANGNVDKMFPPCKEHVHVQCKGSNGEGLDETLMGQDVSLHGFGAHAKKIVPCKCGEAMRLELIRYLRNYQNDDGGWGQHTEGHSTMLGTVLNYISLRMMGLPVDDPSIVSARRWIHAEGGAVYTPFWGKMWLCIMGLYSYDGVSPLPPELVLLPRWVPFSLGRSWCHSRAIALAFFYFYGLRWSASRNPLLDALKMELFTQPLSSICWRSYRHEVCSRDLFTPVTKVFKLVSKVLDLYEGRPIFFLRRYALEKCWKHIAYEDESTQFICLGPVNKALDMLVTWIREGENSTRYQLHQQRVDDYFFMSPVGMYMSSYNGSQLWDTSFAVQAACACKGETLLDEMALAHHYIDVSQVREDPIEAGQFYRHRTKGAWNFSTREQGWQVSDCTAEGLRVVLLLPHIPFNTSRIYDAINLILSLHNADGDGGWASYEPTRAPHYCELFNASEIFKDVMVEHSYVECTSSSIHTLSLFREQYPHYRRRSVDAAINKGIAYVLSSQRPDGSFYGTWAVCFTYAAWIIADALRASKGIPDMANHPQCRKLVDFLISHQNSDGGWGEDINACVRQVWVDNPDGSQVVNTTWAVMAIMSASGEAALTTWGRRQQIAVVVDRGIQLIMSRQLVTGDWAQERISGMFNGNNPVHYSGYKNTMPVWALGKYNTWKKTFLKYTE